MYGSRKKNIFAQRRSKKAAINKKGTVMNRNFTLAYPRNLLIFLFSLILLDFLSSSSPDVSVKDKNCVACIDFTTVIEFNVCYSTRRLSESIYSVQTQSLRHISFGQVRSST